jgi:hypothetical protein
VLSFVCSARARTSGRRCPSRAPGTTRRSQSTQSLCMQPQWKMRLHYPISNRPPGNHWTSSMQSKPPGPPDHPASLSQEHTLPSGSAMQQQHRPQLSVTELREHSNARPAHFSRYGNSSKLIPTPTSHWQSHSQPAPPPNGIPRGDQPLQQPSCTDRCSPSQSRQPCSLSMQR